MTITIKVTPERYNDIVSIDDDMNFFGLTNTEAYNYMIQFVVDEQGNYITPAEARKLFKKVPRKELTDYITKFIRSITDAFVNPTSGAESDEH